MQSVEITGATDAPPSEVRAELYPESIIEYAGNYEVVSAKTVEDKRVLELEKSTSSKEQLRATFEFTELEDGYAYTQRDGEGPFDEMWTAITLEGDDSGTTITVHSEFTFGGIARLVVDRLAAKYRQRELVQLVSNLVIKVEDGETPD